PSATSTSISPLPRTAAPAPTPARQTRVRTRTIPWAGRASGSVRPVKSTTRSGRSTTALRAPVSRLMAAHGATSTASAATTARRKRARRSLTMLIIRSRGRGRPGTGSALDQRAGTDQGGERLALHVAVLRGGHAQQQVLEARLQDGAAGARQEAAHLGLVGAHLVGAHRQLLGALDVDELQEPRRRVELLLRHHLQEAHVDPPR